MEKKNGPMSNNKNTVERIPPTNKYPLAIKKETKRKNHEKRARERGRVREKSVSDY